MWLRCSLKLYPFSPLPCIRVTNSSVAMPERPFTVLNVSVRPRRVRRCLRKWQGWEDIRHSFHAFGQPLSWWPACLYFSEIYILYDYDTQVWTQQFSLDTGRSYVYRMPVACSVPSTSSSLKTMVDLSLKTPTWPYLLHLCTAWKVWICSYYCSVIVKRKYMSNIVLF